MDTAAGTARRHAGWLEHQRRNAADRAALEAASRRRRPQVPPTVTRAGVSFDVLAAVYLPAGFGLVSGHVVLYQERDLSYTVHTLVHGESDWLHQGSYDLTYPAAVRELIRRSEGGVR